MYLVNSHFMVVLQQIVEFVDFDLSNSHSTTYVMICIEPSHSLKAIEATACCKLCFYVCTAIVLIPYNIIT